METSPKFEAKNPTKTVCEEKELISLWTHHQISVLIFLIVILFITLSNIRILRKLGSYPLPLEYPFVSVLVPARNEEDNINGCVTSLLNQDYPNFEVLVLD